AAAIILPSEKQQNPMTDPVGTGPYMLKERKADQYIQLARFDGYKSPEGDENGYGGARHQYLDEIRFVPVPDANTRVEGAVSGQFDYVDSLPVEAYDRLKDQKTTEAVLLKPFGWPVFVMNTSMGITKNQDIRLAIRDSLSMEDMMAAAFGSTDFYSLNPSMYPDGYS
ncbi:ABC transporter substrate-binding protein, partial [Phyllobacterium sp. P5_D12]